jgi:hypothetical protein
VGDNVLGLTSGATATISALYGTSKMITLQNVSNRFLISEEINITSSIPNIGTIVEKIANISLVLFW